MVETSNRARLAWVVLCCTVGAVFLFYFAAGHLTDSAYAGVEAPIMPLDDAYIHFQYAQAIAEGHPLHYNPDQPPTSGATSLLYPAILAVGYILGFTGQRLAWWALGIGTVCWLLSTWLVYRIAAREGTVAAHWIALGIAVSFALSGSLAWAFMSGMETGLVILSILLTLWYTLRNDLRGAALAGAFAALLRPEGAVIGILAVVYLAGHRRGGSVGRFLSPNIGWYGLPVLATFIQPVINAVLTGSITASGLQAKSYLYNVPPDLGLMASNIAATAIQTVRELFTGVGADDGLYFAFILSWLAGAAILIGARRTWRSRRLTPELLILGWLLGLLAAVSTLETAFWQFKRYQQPIIALLFPLAGWALGKLNRIGWRRPVVFGTALLLAILLVGSGVTTINFARYYADNVHEVAASQLPMALFVAQTLPPDATIGVHDIGVMRYLGNHTTYDVVGLTTPGEARAWRNGPGSVFEQMKDSPWRPSYFAIYNDARGLTYLAQTDLFKKPPLAAFPSTSPVRNVASATDSGQFVYKADWAYAAYAAQPWQPSSLRAIRGMNLSDSVNVADLTSEDSHAYRWWNTTNPPGFPTEVYQQQYVACQSPQGNPGCTILDGGRLITGGEEMMIATSPRQDMIWITRVHPRDAASLSLFVNGTHVSNRVIPPIPGQWLEIDSYIPGKLIVGTKTLVRVEATISDPADHYMPYYHWFYQGAFQPNQDQTLPAYSAIFGKAILLSGRALSYNPEKRALAVKLAWQLDSTSDVNIGDAKVFVHLYDQTGKLVAQSDGRPNEGTLPPGNWLPGTLLDNHVINVPPDVGPGTYRVAIGLYDPAHPDVRLPVVGDGADSDGRLFIGMLEIP
ncbi:MAG TPA: hypothetical protein VKQ72_14275 [Aggregatilineales bacterium]|nr:hypothetical protein [Aggregatilineales bacterium]